jgi:hypothetical protein
VHSKEQSWRPWHALGIDLAVDDIDIGPSRMVAIRARASTGGDERGHDRMPQPADSLLYGPQFNCQVIASA